MVEPKLLFDCVLRKLSIERNALVGFCEGRTLQTVQLIQLQLVTYQALSSALDIKRRIDAPDYLRVDFHLEISQRRLSLEQ